MKLNSSFSSFLSANKLFSLTHSIISLSDIPACILYINKSDSLSLKLSSLKYFCLFNSEIILINEVFPHPVSPIIIIGIPARILNKININLM